jgi:hypothetical protein
MHTAQTDTPVTPSDRRRHRHAPSPDTVVVDDGEALVVVVAAVPVVIQHNERMHPEDGRQHVPRGDPVHLLVH